MAKQTQKPLGYRIEDIRWLFWQVLRRSRKYRTAVARLLRLWRKDSRIKVWTPRLSDHKRGRRINRVEAVRAMLRSYKRLRFGELEPSFKRDSAVRIEIWKLDSRGAKRLRRKRSGDRRLTAAETLSLKTKLEGSVSEGLRHRYCAPAVGKSLHDVNFPAESTDALPELKNFVEFWKMRFPVPPSVEVPLDSFMTSHWVWPVTIRDLQFTESVTFEIRPEVGKEIVLAFIGGVLMQSMKTRRDGTTLTSRKHGAKGEILVNEDSQHDLLAKISLPVDKEDALREVGKHLTAHSPHFQKACSKGSDEETVLDREYYKRVLKAIDMRKRGLRLGEGSRRPKGATVALRAGWGPPTLPPERRGGIHRKMVPMNLPPVVKSPVGVGRHVTRDRYQQGWVEEVGKHIKNWGGHF